MVQQTQTPDDSMQAVHSADMSDHLVRVWNLQQLQRTNKWNDSELARQCGRLPQQVHAWFEGKRTIGEKLARSLEDQLQLARYALDDRAGVPHVAEAPPRWGNSPASGVSVRNPARELPLVAWSEINKMLDADNGQLKSKAVHLETFAPSSNRAKFVTMPDDSMDPEFSPGDHLLFDPAEAPRAGDVVLVRIATGEYFVRTFRPRTAYVFDLVASNGNYQSLSSAEDGAEVKAVMVEHRRYRRG